MSLILFSFKIEYLDFVRRGYFLVSVSVVFFFFRIAFESDQQTLKLTLPFAGWQE